MAKICFEYLHCTPLQLAQMPRDQIAFAEAAVAIETEDLENAAFRARAERRQLG